MRKTAICLCVLCLSVWASHTWAFDLVDNSTGPEVDLCHCCTATLNPHPIMHLPAGGAAAMGQQATLLADFPDVNVHMAVAAPGTLTIDRYFAWCQNSSGGAGLVARYDDGDRIKDWVLPWPFSINPSYRWIQEINTNKPLGGTTSPYIDPRPNDDKGIPLPYYWTDPEVINKYTNGNNVFGDYDLQFRDFPSRRCTQFVTWRADLFLVSENYFTDPQGDPLHTITIYDGVAWGFNLMPSYPKWIDIHILDRIRPGKDKQIEWSEGRAESQTFGTATVLTLHPGGVTTSAAGEEHEDYQERMESYHGEFYTVCDYVFDVVIEEQTNLSVFINRLDFDSQWDISIPIVEKTDVTDISMTINLDEGLLVILDESLTTQRSGDALYIGDFDDFAADPAAFGFDLAGFRDIELEHTFIPEPATISLLVLGGMGLLIRRKRK